MSMNIAFEATRKIKVLKTDKIETQTTYFREVIQTPTNITYQIVNSKDPYQTYRDYVLEACQDYEAEIFDDDDLWCERPLGREVRNNGPDYVKMFDEWLLAMQEAGYDVEPIIL